MNENKIKKKRKPKIKKRKLTFFEKVSRLLALSEEYSSLNPRPLESFAPNYSPRGTVIWECKNSTCEHPHIWSIAIRTRLNQGNNCPYCGHRKICPCNSFMNLIPALALEFDHEKNADLDPFTLSLHSSIPVAWKCPVTSCDK